MIGILLAMVTNTNSLHRTNRRFTVIIVMCDISFAFLEHHNYNNK